MAQRTLIGRNWISAKRRSGAARRPARGPWGTGVEALEARRLLAVAVNPDAYVALEGTSLNVAAPGVLGNDTSTTGAALAVTGFTQPSDGTLTLNPDGSFAYLPKAGYTGTDAFTYTATDARGAKGVGTVTLAVNATTEEASVFAGSRLASVGSAQGTLLNAVTGGLLGTNLNLDAADYTGLANGSLDGGRLADALGAQLGVTPAQALKTNVTLAQVYTAAASVAQADGDTAEATAFRNLGLAVPGLAAPIQLGNLIQVSPASGSLAGSNLNGLDLLTGTAQLFNYQNVAATPTPVTVSGAALGLPAVVSSVAISSQVVEPPVITIGPAGTQFHTAAVRLRTDLNLDESLDTTALTAALRTALGAAVTPTATAMLNQLSVFTEVAEGQGTIASIDAIANAVTLRATPGLADVYVGNIADNLFFDRTHVINPDADVTYGTVGTLDVAATATATGTPIANQSTGIQVRGVALGDAPTAATEVFNAPFPRSTTVSTGANFLTNLADTLANSLTVRFSGSLGATLDPLVAGTILPAVRPVVTAAVTPLLAPTLADVADPALRALGTGVGELDLTVQAVAAVAAPAANPDAARTPEDQAVVVPVLANDATIPGQPATVTAVTQPAHGTAAINPDGTITYTPTPGYFGPDTFDYTITTPAGLTSTGVVGVTVTPPAPVARPDTYAPAENTPLTVPAAAGVLSNDTDPNNLPLTATILTPPARGTVVLNPDGSFTYTPTTGDYGPDTFTYQASNGTTPSDPVTVTLDVAPALPVAAPDTYSTAPGATLTIPAATGVLSNDVDPNNLPLAAAVATAPTKGTLTLNPDGSLTYVPAAGATGTDTFTYTATDANGASRPATVTVDIVAGAPTTVPDAYTTTAGTPLAVPVATGVLANDTDPNGLPLAAALVAGPAHGTVTLNPDGSLNYVPAAGYTGTDSFTYRATDTTGPGDPAVVTITVRPGAPTTVPDAFATTAGTTLTVPAAAGVLGNDVDPNGLPLTAAVVAGPTHGTLTLNPDGSLSYTPAAGYTGTDSFTYRAADADLPGNTAAVTITIAAAPAGPAGTPVANPDAYTTTAGTPLAVPVATGVLANDSDPNALPLSAIIATQPAHGTITLNPDGSFTYAPTAGYTGTDTFTYLASDGTNRSTPATVTVVVNPVTVTGTGPTAPPTVVTTFPITGTVGVPIVGAPVVTFADGDGSTPPGSYTATIDFGDGTAPSVGTVTEADGVYEVTGTHTYAAAATYPVGVTITRPGAVGLAAATTAVIAPAATTTGPTAAPSSLAGTVYLDANRNGRADANEYGIATVVVTLTGTTTAGLPVMLTTTTDANGRYAFTGLAAGVYRVGIAAPTSAFKDGQATVGTAGGAVAGESVAAITLGASTAATGYDFGELARGNCRLNTPAFRTLLRVGPTAPLPSSFRPVALSSTGPIATYLPTLAARATARTTAAAVHIKAAHPAKVSHAAAKAAHAAVKVVHAQARPKAPAHRHK